MRHPAREREGGAEAPAGAGREAPDAREAQGAEATQDGQDAQAQAFAARRRLVAVLGKIADLAGERSLERCPYRSARDVCTFRGECGNRSRPPGGKPLCTGGPLNARGPAPDELAAALEQAERGGAAED